MLHPLLIEFWLNKMSELLWLHLFSELLGYRPSTMQAEAEADPNFMPNLNVVECLGGMGGFHWHASRWIQRNGMD